MGSSAAIANLHTHLWLVGWLIGCREEVEAGETQLVFEGGRPLREVAVLNVFLKNSRGQTLYEAEQVRGWVGEGRVAQRHLRSSGGCAPGAQRVMPLSLPAHHPLCRCRCCPTAAGARGGCR